MDVLNSQCHLDKPVEDLILAVAHASNLLLVSDFGVEITAIRVVHDNTQASFIHKRLLISDDVWMSHSFQHMHLVDCIFALLSVHLRHINDLHHICLAICYGLHLYGVAEATLTDDFELAIPVHVFQIQNIIL